MLWRSASELSRLRLKRPERLVRPDAKDAIFFFPDGFEPDSSTILRYIVAKQIENGPQEAVDRISKAHLVVGVTMGLHGQLVAQLDNPDTQFFGLTIVENWGIRKPHLGSDGTTLSCSHSHHLGLQLGELLFEGEVRSVRVHGFRTHHE